MWPLATQSSEASRTRAPFHVCEVSCRARTERCPTVCRLGRLQRIRPVGIASGAGPPLPQKCGTRRIPRFYAARSAGRKMAN